MIKEGFQAKRNLKEEILMTDLAITGGGMSGVCCALTAAREGIKVVLIQDRPVLGGNASSEVRLWILGATSHMGNNNRWAREGGVIDEILVENTYRNKEGNHIILDTILLEKVSAEPNITLLLNTAVYEVHKKADDEISGLRAFCSQNSTMYQVEAPLFCDASGDGIVAFQAGASFRMGAETPEEFGEGFAPDIEDYGELLGHSIYFYTKDVGQPVRFTAPAYAIKNAGELPRIRNYQLQDHGCRLWWVEHGGRMDTIHQSEEIKWELWRVIYGIWDYVKNSGEFPESENLTLEWVGTIPGKRESRRFMGDYILKQQDVVEQRAFEDAISFGGWSLDLHPADGVFGDKNGCNQWHSKGIYQIPYRCYYSKDIKNLFLAGRIISASHVAFGSSRVMATCAHGAQAVGMAAVIAIKNNILLRGIGKFPYIKTLQKELNKKGQSIPMVALADEENLVNKANARVSSELSLTHLPFDGPWMPLEFSAAQMLPLRKGIQYHYKIRVKATKATTLQTELRISSKKQNHTPDITLGSQSIALQEGEQEVNLTFPETLPDDQYAFLCLMKNEDVEVKGCNVRATGLLTVFNKVNKAVSNFGKQEPPEGLGIEAFEFWCPHRRPDGHNFGMEISPALETFGVNNLKNGYFRPNFQPNAWVAHWEDEKPELTISWSQPQTIREIVLMFDTDFDHPMESALMGHPEDVMPFCVQNYSIRDGQGNVLFEKTGNHQTINRVKLDSPVETNQLIIALENPGHNVPASLFGVFCY